VSKEITIIFTIFAIAGLCMAGAEAEPFGRQVLINTFGMLLFAGAMVGISVIQRGAGK